jgi:hypothetical protein
MFSVSAIELGHTFQTYRLCSSRSFTSPILQRHDLRMMFSRMSAVVPRWYLLLLLAAAPAGAIWAMILVRSPGGSASRPGTPPRPVLLRAIEPRAAEALRQAQARPNPAMQKTGPPDPRAVTTSAASAQKAAQAAAELAGSSTSIN